jgi:hypothetical protein
MSDPTPRTLLQALKAKGRPSVLVLSRFPAGDDLKDGYYQRILSVDALLAGTTRIYVHNDHSHAGLHPSITELADGAFDVRCRTGFPPHLLWLARVARACSAAYAHSIYAVQKRRHRWLFRLARKRILDVHGAVPEEATLMGSRHARRMARVEAKALPLADVIVSVTDAMNAHVRRKYALPSDAKEFIRLPIFPRVAADRPAARHSRNVVYCGGLQAWQQVDRMFDYVRAHPEASYTFLVPDPAELRRRYAARHAEEFPGVVASASSEEVRRHYARNAFGLVLREDIVVNRVACPTKLIEYLQHDLVPIVDSEEVGDFKALGMRAVGLTQPLPEAPEWQEMVSRNREALARLDDAFRSGAAAVARAVASGGRAP